MWTGIRIRIGIACVVGILIALLLIPFLPETEMNGEAAAEEEIMEADDKQEDAPPEAEIHITRVEAVEIPEIVAAQEIPDVAEEAAPAIEELIHVKPEEQSAEVSPDPQELEPVDAAPTQTAGALESINLSSEELAVFIRTQTVDSRAKSFPRIHIAYENVDMKAQLGFYKSRGYGFFAVEMENGVIVKLLGRIDMSTRQLSAIDGRAGLAWNYGSVIMKYRQIATEASANPNAYLAVVPTYDVANLILGSIDKALNGVIDGDYGNYRSYKATFTTRGRDAILTVLIPNGNSFTRRDILLSGNS